MNVKFLLRFDDLCPTINWDVWQKLETIMLEENVSPIISVIPDNQDSSFFNAPADSHFWDRVRGWQARGWSIGLHGYQHRYVNKEAGMIGLNHYSEFAGLPLEEQYTKLRKGLEIFAREAVRADVWVAPAHSFDHNTVRALSSLGVKTISDGMSLFPYRDCEGTFWVPQQLWKFRAAPFGVWTVCVHPPDKMFKNADFFRQCIRQHKKSLTTLAAVSEHYANRKHTLVDSGFAHLWSLAIRVKAGISARTAKDRNTEAPQMENDSGHHAGLHTAG
jgi:predicted deacetylase